MKGISPLIAVVLLIAFTIVIGGVFLLWARGFVGETVVEVGERAREEVECAYGFIELLDLEYCNQDLSGNIFNKGTIKLKNITLHILYPPPTVPSKFPLCKAGEKVITCDIANLSIDVNEVYPFNISTASGFIEIRVFSHCAGVYHRVRSDLVDFC